MKQKEKSIKLNAALNIVKTVLSLAYPLVTFPYAARVLLPEGIGKYNFAHSIVSYFILLAGLGIGTYAIREGAKVRNDPEKAGAFIDNMFSINIYTTAISYIILILACLLIPKLGPYTAIIMILSLQIGLGTISIGWMYSIYEEYFVQTIITLVMQLAAIALMFIFVKSPADLDKYTIITVIAYSGAGFFMFFYGRRFHRMRFILKPDLSHMKRILIIFSTAIAATIYISSDVTILGWIAGDRYTGLYGTSANIYRIVKQILNAIVAVVVPRFAFYLGTQQNEKLKELGEGLINYMLTICLPAMVGLFFLSRPIIVLFAGDKYVEATVSLQLLSIALIFAVFANFFANCVLLAFRQEMTVMRATIISSVLNLVLNIIMIPLWFEKAAAFTTILAEITMCAIVYVRSRKYLKVGADIRNVIPVLIGCACVGMICTVSKKVFAGPAVQIVVSVICSVAAYGLIQLAMKNTAAVEMIRNRKEKGAR